MSMDRDEPALRRAVKLGVALAAVLALTSCKSELPAPVYPSPEDAPLEETELWQYFEEPSLDEEEEADEAWHDEVDEGWDEGEEEFEPPPDEADGHEDVEPPPGEAPQP